MSMYVDFAVTVRLPGGSYITITVAALDHCSAASAAQAMFPGCDVARVVRLGDASQ